VQDAWAVKERLNSQEMLMLGVFDGHGAEGKVVSNHIATNLHKIMAKSALCKVWQDNAGSSLCRKTLAQDADRLAV
jgi:serine/threonine protein phosphatase PrpC